MSKLKRRPRPVENDEDERLYLQERFILNVTDAILRALKEKGISTSDLAWELGRSRTSVAQALSGERTLTLRNLSDMAWVAGVFPQVSMRSLDHFDENPTGRAPTP